AQLRTLLIAAKRCGAAAIVAALGSGSVGAPHGAIDPTTGTIPRTGRPIILYGNDRAATLTAHARILTSPRIDLVEFCWVRDNQRPRSVRKQNHQELGARSAPVDHP